jgi:hypothetical protein
MTTKNLYVAVLTDIGGGFGLYAEEDFACEEDDPTVHALINPEICRGYNVRMEHIQGFAKIYESIAPPQTSSNSSAAPSVDLTKRIEDMEKKLFVQGNQIVFQAKQLALQSEEYVETKSAHKNELFMQRNEFKCELEYQRNEFRYELDFQVNKLSFQNDQLALEVDGLKNKVDDLLGDNAELHFRIYDKEKVYEKKIADSNLQKQRAIDAMTDDVQAVVLVQNENLMTANYLYLERVKAIEKKYQDSQAINEKEKKERLEKRNLRMLEWKKDKKEIELKIQQIENQRFFPNFVKYSDFDEDKLELFKDQLNTILKYFPMEKEVEQVAEKKENI